MKDLIHEPLEGLGSVAQAERHHQKLKETKGSYDGRLRNVLVSHRNMMKAFGDIKFRKDFLAREVLGKILDVGQRVAIRCGYLVQGPIITTRSPRSVRLPYHMKRRGPRRGRSANYVQLKHLIKFSLGITKTDGIQTSALGENWLTSSDDVVTDGMSLVGEADLRKFRILRLEHGENIIAGYGSETI